ncbi:protein Mdm4 isoform X2 [Meles meles]|uniref:protein Mdm4 isoform X2 n=1 Tax=Meles meles TaxID=9662 RepID=UPI001E69973E|nr:protein Mdm4 isoform X2 [Meles meles]
MTSFSTSAQCSTSDSACRISPEQTNQVRPKQPLLKILQAAGAQGEMFTVKEVMHYLGQYIMVKKLYDQREQHMVYCGGDLLGELLGRQSFSVKDPSPLYDMLRKNLITLPSATTAFNMPSIRVAPGWLSGLSRCLRLGSWSRGPGIESRIGLSAQR